MADYFGRLLWQTTNLVCLFPPLSTSPLGRFGWQFAGEICERDAFGAFILSIIE
jgi:hypothetical protein